MIWIFICFFFLTLEIFFFNNDQLILYSFFLVILLLFILIKKIIYIDLLIKNLNLKNEFKFYYYLHTYLTNILNIIIKFLLKLSFLIFIRLKPILFYRKIKVFLKKIKYKKLLLYSR